MNGRESLVITNINHPELTVADVAVWPLGHAATVDRQGRPRVVMTLHTGVAALNLHMTKAEAARLGDMLTRAAHACLATPPAPTLAVVGHNQPRRQLT